MAKVLQTTICNERPGVIRVAVQIQTHRDGYVHNMVYDDLDAVESRLDADIAALLETAQLCADLQDELDAPEYKQETTDTSIKVKPCDRRVFVEPVNLLRGKFDHTITLSLQDKVEDSDPDSQSFLQHENEGRVTTVVKNVRSVKDIKRHFADHQAKHSKHTDRVKRMKKLLKQYGKTQGNKGDA